MESLLRTGVFLVLGGLLVLVNLWFIQAVRESFFGDGIVIASFDVVGGSSDPRLGRTLASLLQARLRQVQTDLQWAQESLTHAPKVPTTGNMASEPHQSDQSGKPPPPMPALWADPVNLNTALFEPVDINVNVGGVEVGRLVPWVQRTLVKSHSLHFTVSFEKDKTIIAGNIGSLDVPVESVWIETDAITPAKIADVIAHELILQKLSSDSRNRFGAIDRIEFQILATTLCDAAKLNDRIAHGRPVQQEFADLLPNIEKLVEKVPEWHELLFLAAAIAENSGAREKAILFYTRLDKWLSIVPTDSLAADPNLRTIVTSKIKELRTALPKGFFAGLGRRIVAFTGLFEFGSDSPEQLFATVVGDLKGNDLKFGVASWSFGTGTLIPLLRAFQKADPQRFGELLGDGAGEIEAVLAGSREDGLAFARHILDHKRELVEPWNSRFKALGCDPKFQDIQVRTLETFFRRAVALMDEFGLRSERGLTLCFNAIFQMGGIREKIKDAIMASFAAYEQEHQRQPGEIQRMRLIAHAITQNAFTRFPKLIPALGARYDLIANGSGAAPGGKTIDMDKRGLRLADFRTGQPITEATSD
jgi:hypothetical protein